MSCLVIQAAADFAARRYAGAAYAVIVCLSVRLSVRVYVCLAQLVGVLLRWLNLKSSKQRNTT